MTTDAAPFADDLVRQVQGVLLARMEALGIDMAELARRLNLDRLVVAQMFTPDAEALTIRRVAGAAHVLGLSVRIALDDAP